MPTAALAERFRRGLLRIRNQCASDALLLIENNKGTIMRYTVAIAVALGVSALAACNSSPQEEQAENIEANAENTADMIEENAGAMAENIEANAANTAEEVREEGDNAADAVEDTDGNTAE